MRRHPPPSLVCETKGFGVSGMYFTLGLCVLDRLVVVEPSPNPEPSPHPGLVPTPSMAGPRLLRQPLALVVT